MAQAAPAPATPGASSPAAQIPGQQAPTRGPAALVEARISELHEQLHITPAQERPIAFHAAAPHCGVGPAIPQSKRDHILDVGLRGPISEIWRVVLTAQRARPFLELMSRFDQALGLGG